MYVRLYGAYLSVSRRFFLHPRAGLIVLRGCLVPFNDPSCLRAPHLITAFRAFGVCCDEIVYDGLYRVRSVVRRILVCIPQVFLASLCRIDCVVRVSRTFQ